MMPGDGPHCLQRLLHEGATAVLLSFQEQSKQTGLAASGVSAHRRTVEAPLPGLFLTFS